MKRANVIFLVDMESFYASIEHAANPQYDGRPLVVSGDVNRRSGVILAACPLAKAKGVRNAERLFEAQQKCPDLVVVKPHMQRYVDISLQISKILGTFTDLVEPYSIDEQFMDVTGSQKLFGPPYEIAEKVKQAIMDRFGVKARVGIGENKVLAKLACDNFAKKSSEGIYWLRKDSLDLDLWCLPIEKLFGVGRKMSVHLRNMGIRTIGQLAQTDGARIKKRFGVHGQVLWMSANGEDYSPVTRAAHARRKGYGNGMTLPRDYVKKEDICVVLLELCEEVCARLRQDGWMGSTVSLSVNGADFVEKRGFHRQYTIPFETNITMEVYEAACALLERFWDGYPIRRLSIGVSNLQSDQNWQLSLFDDNASRDRLSTIGYVMDGIRQKYGKLAIQRASSLQKASQLRDRSQKIGGHYK
ncbi:MULTISPECIES: DNA polymerase IV [Shouchella]|uniref:DNA polymerase IV n=2 Tax=Shouchella TaxID=2893057 RepID=Q5WBA3_SHOC1|nr:MULTISPECIES: DNA polymerase IV [Shouchella]MCM3311164.1 DNA polymerase IV [Psychrobacillus sp. MER TA 17]KKI85926.1 DNA polymerase IV [Shouchella clausii]PAD17509.1 DNA polymerase IV [Shouchella clausii]PAD47360.1 DNA polymerase IV [Shouchella clausii]PAE96418.1 DNA polymerase IV [Shouchella clausii]